MPLVQTSWSSLLSSKTLIKYILVEKLMDPDLNWFLDEKRPYEEDDWFAIGEAYKLPLEPSSAVRPFLSFPFLCVFLLILIFQNYFRFKKLVPMVDLQSLMDQAEHLKKPPQIYAIHNPKLAESFLMGRELLSTRYHRFLLDIYLFI